MRKFIVTFTTEVEFDHLDHDLPSLRHAVFDRAQIEIEMGSYIIGDVEEITEGDPS